MTTLAKTNLERAQAIVAQAVEDLKVAGALVARSTPAATFVLGEVQKLDQARYRARMAGESAQEAAVREALVLVETQLPHTLENERLRRDLVDAADELRQLAASRARR